MATRATKSQPRSNRRKQPARTASRRRPSGRARHAPAFVKMAQEMEQKASEQPAPNDAIQLLEQDHREVEQFLEAFEESADSKEKSELAQKICVALTVHAEIEEQRFYPKARRAIEETDLLDEAEVEHTSVKQLIAEIEKMSPRDRLFEAKVKVLGEYVKHHVKEEENELFPKVKDSKMDLARIGEDLSELKLELLNRLAKKR
jgi:hemerythrin superfamily protein